MAKMPEMTVKVALVGEPIEQALDDEPRPTPLVVWGGAKERITEIEKRLALLEAALGDLTAYVRRLVMAGQHE